MRCGQQEDKRNAITLIPLGCASVFSTQWHADSLPLGDQSTPFEIYISLMFYNRFGDVPSKAGRRRNIYEPVI